MAQPSHDHAPVIDPQFIAPHPLEVIVQKYPCRSLVIRDINHKILLKVIPCDTNFHRLRLLLGAKDEPLVLLREKNLRMHKQWVAFRVGSTAGSNIIFRTKTEHMRQINTNIVSVLLGDSDDCELKIQGSWENRNCSIGDSSTIKAQMHHPKTLTAEDKFTVTIQPNMDYAIVVALFAIVDAMENPYQPQGFALAALLAVDVIPILAAFLV